VPSCPPSAGTARPNSHSRSSEPSVVASASASVGSVRARQEIEAPIEQRHHGFSHRAARREQIRCTACTCTACTRRRNAVPWSGPSDSLPALAVDRCADRSSAPAVSAALSAWAVGAEASESRLADAVDVDVDGAPMVEASCRALSGSHAAAASSNAMSTAKAAPSPTLRSREARPPPTLRDSSNQGRAQKVKWDAAAAVTTFARRSPDAPPAVGPTA
jgi:hypothetical protein